MSSYIYYFYGAIDLLCQESVNQSFRWFRDTVTFVTSFIHLALIIPPASFVAVRDILESASGSTHSSCLLSK